MSGKSSLMTCLAGLAIAMLMLLAPMTSYADDDAQVLRIHCKGKPYWCVRVANESRAPVEVYIDGQRLGNTTIDGSKVAWYAIPPGTHKVNVCLAYAVAKKVCYDPETMTGDQEYTIEVYDPKD